MSQPIIVLGDKTSHGGTVISASPFSDTHGKGWARVGDMVACKRCRGIFPIAEGDQSVVDDGRPVAYHGCKVSCGAVLISGQMFTTTEPSAGAGEAAGNASSPEGFGAVAQNMLAAYGEEPLDSTKRRFRGRFQVIDRASGEPAAGQSARVASTGGQHLDSCTDAEGFTSWVERDASEALSFQLTEKQPQS